MAVQLENTTKRFRGLSTDRKPGCDADVIGEPLQRIPAGSVFTEIDTGRRYLWPGSWPWVLQEQTVEVLLRDLIEVNERMLDVLEKTKFGHEAYLWGETVE